MRVLAAIIVLLIIVLVAYAAARAVARRREARELREAKWERVTWVRNGHFFIALIKKGEDPIIIDRIPEGLPAGEYWARLSAAEQEADDKLTSILALES